MAEILIRVVDKVNMADSYANYQCSKRGDVIVVMPDGWGWSPRELTNPDWRILKLPGVGVSVFAEMVQSEIDTLTHEALALAPLKRTWLKRVNMFDLSIPQIPKAIRDYIADSARTAPFYVVDTSKFDITSIKMPKALVPDI